MALKQQRHLTNEKLPDLLAPKEWVLDEPLALEDLRLVLRPYGAAGEPKSRVLKGLDLSGKSSYSQALCEVAGLKFFNGPVYRLVRVWPGAPLKLEFRVSHYFDYLDTSEVIAYLPGSRRSKAYRKNALQSGPFDFSNRIASLGVNTLTIRVDRRTHRHRFYLMHRNSAKVINDASTYCAVPSGEFTPFSDTILCRSRDCSIWRNTVREYAEEYLKIDEAKPEVPTDREYIDREPFCSINRAYDAGEISMKVLGLGLDPLIWKPELITVALFEAETFDNLFGEIVEENHEGNFLDIGGSAWTEKNVNRYIADPKMSASGRACVRLGWRHREALGVGYPFA